MPEPAQKCEKSAILKQYYTLKLFIAFKMAYSYCLSLGGILDFLQKRFYNINSWSWLSQCKQGWPPLGTTTVYFRVPMNDHFKMQCL